MNTLSPALLKRTHATLRHCSQFNDPVSLKALFVTDELRPFGDGLPDAINKSDRVSRTVAYLLSQTRTDGQPVFSLFLYTLCDQYPVENALHGDIAALLAAIYGEPETSAEPNGSKTSGPSAAASSQPVVNSGKAWAVLVGINRYERGSGIRPLHVCVHDAAAISELLTTRYTGIRLLTDATPQRLPTRANILSELSAVADAAEEGDLLLFYFSGHGHFQDGESYLLPRDTRLAALKLTTIAISDLTDLMRASRARAKVIVLDACHSGAAIGKAGSAMSPEFIDRVFTQAQGMATIASCKQGQLSWEWSDKQRSVFTHFFLEALRGQADLDSKGLVTVQDVNRYVTDGVTKWSVDHNLPQSPTIQASMVGDIVLVDLS